MGVRTVCFALAIVTTGPLRWVFIAGAVLLPYIAVVFANAGRERAGAAPMAPGTPSLVAIDRHSSYDGPVEDLGSHPADDGHPPRPFDSTAAH